MVDGDASLLHKDASFNSEAMRPTLRAITAHSEDLECRLSIVVERVIAAQIAFIEGASLGRL